MSCFWIRVLLVVSLLSELKELGSILLPQFYLSLVACLISTQYRICQLSTLYFAFMFHIFALLCFAFLWLFALILHFFVCYFARITNFRVGHCSHQGLAQVLYTRLLARGSKQRLQKQRRLRSVSIKVLKLVS